MINKPIHFVVKRILLTALVLMVAFNTLGQTRAQDTVTLTVMLDPGLISDEEIQAFMDANPDIVIERIAIDQTRLNAMFAAGEAPDVFKSSGADIPSYVERGWLLDLKPYFEASEILNEENLIALPFQYWQYEEGWYGMNRDWSPDNSIFISRAAFEAAGLEIPDPEAMPTYAQLGEWAAALTEMNGQRTVRMGWDNYFNDAILQTILMEQGQDLYSEDFTQALIKDNEIVVDVLRYFADLAKQNVIWNPLNPSASWGGEDFLQGKLGGVNYGYWYHGMVTTTPDVAVTADDVLMLRGPSWFGDKAINIPFGGSGASIAATTQHPEAAWRFFEYYMGGTPAETRAKSGWGVPALKSLLPLMPQETAFDQQTYAMVQTEIAEDSQVRRLNPYFSTGVFNNSWTANLEQYLRDEITFEQLVENLDTDVNTAIQEGIAATQAES